MYVRAPHICSSCLTSFGFDSGELETAVVSSSPVGQRTATAAVADEEKRGVSEEGGVIL